MSPDVRKFVARALGRFDREEARTQLGEMEQTDTVAYVRDTAAKWLNRT